MGENHYAIVNRVNIAARLLLSGSGQLEDSEMIEAILNMALGDKESKVVAGALISRFGNYESAISASPSDLMDVIGLGKRGMTALKLVQVTSQRLLRFALLDKPLFDNWDKLVSYLQALLAHEHDEQCRVLFLDGRYRLIADEALAVGTVNHVYVHPRVIVTRAIQAAAAGIILVHNHPSGDPTPSKEDISQTKRIKSVCSSLGISLHDHIIVGNGECLSFRKLKLL